MTASPQIAVALTPVSVTLNPAQTQTFSATVTGTANTAVTFDGVDDKIDVLYQPALNPSGAFTCEIWAKAFNGSTHRSPLTSRDDTPVGTTAGYIFYLTPENIWSMWSGAGAGNGWMAVNGPPLTEDDWTRINRDTASAM